MWYYRGEEFTEVPEDMVGFVYLITELDSGKKYVGQKRFWSTRKLPPLKGKKRRRSVTKESDWRNYFGSNEDLKVLVESNGGDKYHREILYLCRSLGVMNYMETKEQFDRNVLLRDDYFNGIINCKIHSKHVQGMANASTD